MAQNGADWGENQLEGVGQVGEGRCQGKDDFRSKSGCGRSEMAQNGAKWLIIGGCGTGVRQKIYLYSYRHSCQMDGTVPVYIL